MAKRYRVTLTEEVRPGLERMINSGAGAARKLAHARVLLKADEAEGGPGWCDERGTGGRESLKARIRTMDS